MSLSVEKSNDVMRLEGDVTEVVKYVEDQDSRLAFSLMGSLMTMDSFRGGKQVTLDLNRDPAENYKNVVVTIDSESVTIERS